MRLDLLGPGDGFHLSLTNRTGRVLKVNAMGVRVVYTDRRERRAFATANSTIVEFEVERRMTISDGTDVEPT